MLVDFDTPQPGLSITVARAGDGAVRLVLAGETDLATVDLLRDKVDEVLARTATAVVVDLAGVTYLDSTGIGALINARNRANAHGGTVWVTDPQPMVHHVLDITGALTALTPTQH